MRRLRKPRRLERWPNKSLESERGSFRSAASPRSAPVSPRWSAVSSNKDIASHTAPAHPNATSPRTRGPSRQRSAQPLSPAASETSWRPRCCRPRQSSGNTPSVLTVGRFTPRWNSSRPPPNARTCGTCGFPKTWTPRANTARDFSTKSMVGCVRSWGRRHLRPRSSIALRPTQGTWRSSTDTEQRNIRPSGCNRCSMERSGHVLE
mmetsp:Transcript_17283/g.37494  ORF Transcript_17283/g.37494 Transcript_17283/m.37494 type:complete len:206 (-) Transcript_17283:749-1366(-)